jgi:hypothetical protein
VEVSICVGMLKLDRKSVDSAVREGKQKKWEFIARRSGLVSVLKWYDKNVTMVSAYHSYEKRNTETKKKRCLSLLLIISSMCVMCCQDGDVGLCLEDCFEAYCTKLNYEGDVNFYLKSLIL